MVYTNILMHRSGISNPKNILYQNTHEKHLHDAWIYITFITIQPSTFATKRSSRYSLQITSGEVERCG